jgi:hypothetical protein
MLASATTTSLASKRLSDMIDAMNVSKAGLKHYSHQSLDVNGIINLIIHTRGSLLHFNLNNPKGTPFNHVDYKHIELVLFYLALISLIMKVGAKVPIKNMMAANWGVK